MAAKAGDNPDSLMALTTAFCLRNLRRTMCYLGERNKLCLRSDVFLPSEICDKLVNTYMELVHMDSNFEPQDGFFQLFSDPHSTRLTRVQLREDFVRDRDLEAIGKQEVIADTYEEGLCDDGISESELTKGSKISIFTDVEEQAVEALLLAKVSITRGYISCFGEPPTPASELADTEGTA